MSTTSSTHPDLATSVFATTVRDLAERTGENCTVHLRPGRHANAQTAIFRKRISATTAVLQEGPAEQAWTAAHELGHLIAARRRGPARSAPWAFLVAWPVAVFLGILVPEALLAWVVGPATPEGSSPRWGLITAVVVPPVTVSLLLVWLGLRWLCRHKQALEAEVDGIAKELGHPVTPEIADMLERHELEQNPKRKTTPRALRYRTHPLPQDRINVH